MCINKAIALTLVVVGLISLVAIQGAKSQSNGAIFINADGSVSGTSKIQRSGSLYTLADDIFDSPIIVQCNDIILDGAGFALQGAAWWGTPPAINLTCSNVTVRNFYIVRWEVGVLGAYNDNNIANNNITGCERAIAVYADGYIVVGNHIADNTYGVRIQGKSNIVQGNVILYNDMGFWITSSSGNLITANHFEDNMIAVDTDYGGFQLYHNNFINQTVGSTGAWSAMILKTAYSLPEANNTFLTWDNAYPSGGNYWSDYAARYPNASAINSSGIGDTPYLIGTYYAVNSTTVNTYIVDAIDRYPLLAPFDIAEISMPSPSHASSSSPPISPSPTIPEFPSWIVLSLLVVSTVSLLSWVKQNRWREGKT